MNTEDSDKQDDRLLEDYRRASEAQAGRPAESTRRAILEAARAEARRRQPAANDSRYMWSAAAGVAVLGIALVLMRQVDPRPTAPVAMEQRSDEELSAPAQSPSVQAVPAPAADEPRPAEPPSQVARVAENNKSPRPNAERENSDAGFAKSEVARADADPGAEKLRALFPDAWSSDSPPAMVWVVEDARGNTLRQGTLASGEALPEIGTRMRAESGLSARSAAIESAKSAETAGTSAVADSAAPPTAAMGQLADQSAWTIQITRNAAGIPVQIATAREEPSPAAPAAAPR